jgi:hypothetical protein
MYIVTIKYRNIIQQSPFVGLTADPNLQVHRKKNRLLKSLHWLIMGHYIFFRTKYHII